MDDRLLGYLIDAIDADERAGVEAELRANEAARVVLQRLEAAIAPLEADREWVDPPPGLADRTIARLAALSAAPRESPVSPARWRRLDAVVAAGILVMLGGLGVSSIGRVRHAETVAACQNNLRQYHAALSGYSLAHGDDFPQVGDAPPINRAGAFHTILQDAGVLPNDTVMLCPSRPEAAVYAYCLGYRDPAGHLWGLKRTDHDLLPIMSDRESPIGHGNGHNVLFVDGHVRFTTSPNVGVDGDNIFVNQASRVAAGLHRLDSVLAVGDTAP